MDSLPSAQQLYEQLINDTQACEALLNLLSEERAALKARDMDEMERILTEKTQHLEYLEMSANERSILARQYSSDSDSKNWSRLLRELNNEELSQCWVKLKDLLRLCKLENEVNGKLLSRNHQVYSRLLEIVRGQSQAPSLYTAHGSSTAGGSSNIVGQA